MSQNDIATHDEVLELLTKHAREGSISAAIALERALRARRPEEDDDFDAEVRRLVGD
jgi:hypothetical protein